VSIGSPKPSGGLFFVPGYRKEVKAKEIPPPLSFQEDRLEYDIGNSFEI
jgi:hypothetical protein